MPRTDPMKLQWKARSEITTANRAKHALAQARLLELEVVLNNTLNDIARETGISRAAIEGFFRGRRAGYKRSNDGVSLRNAAIHQLSAEHQERGEKFLFTSPESQDDIEDRMRWLEDNPTARIAAEQAIRDLRDQKTNQVRDTHQGRQVDTVAIQKVFDHETQAFHRRTNGHSCGFVCRGSVGDTAQPSFFGTSLSKSFFEDVLHVPAEELVFAYEAYCTSGGAKGASEKIAKRVINLKHSIRATLDAALQRASADPAAKMQYKKFGQGVEDKYKITLRGWPLDELQNPSDISSVLLLSRVHGALIKGACYFEKMTDTELAHRALRLEQELEQARERRIVTMDLARAEGRPLKRRRLPEPSPATQEDANAPRPLALPEPEEAATRPTEQQDVLTTMLDPAPTVPALEQALVQWELPAQVTSPAGRECDQEEVEGLLLDMTGQTPNLAFQSSWERALPASEQLPDLGLDGSEWLPTAAALATEPAMSVVPLDNGDRADAGGGGDETLDLELDRARAAQEKVQGENGDVEEGDSEATAEAGGKDKRSGRRGVPSCAKQPRLKQAVIQAQPKQKSSAKSGRFDIDFAELDRERRAGAGLRRRGLTEMTNRGDGLVPHRSQRGTD
ncbi:hypothetical protein CALVIDRAFT_561315 [Calocera viscosa TUFC12733]|uniref:Uncharacterized protein n=1 Tax=Calocera viscosa (strain TUFC12733) TaxID=1330018 RepID=A0A167Q691_CALVF|nr:hypothetical protein CALVIDRAFT_561315 [Calocera viscosa TUFC12733]